MKASEEKYEFENEKEKNMTIDDVKKHVEKYVKENKEGMYRFMVGTDSQVFNQYTKFVTGIVIKKEGKILWNCHMIYDHKEEVNVMKEKIAFETTLTENVVAMLDETVKGIEVIEGVELAKEGHIDVGLTNKSKTRAIAGEMIERIRRIGFTPKVKPYSLVASSYANKYTKGEKNR